MLDEKKIESFKELVERHFLDIEDADIAAKRKSFITDIQSSKITDKDVLDLLTNYFISIFWLGEYKTTNRPLHTSRDFALKLYAEVFSDIVDGIKDDPVKIIDFTMFLAGINDYPIPLSDSPLSEPLDLIAKGDETVLITGETGTGKELHAKVVHFMSPRKKEKFIALNCAGIPDSLLESELFGHLKGAFTGADKAKKGFLEEVGEGTLFLDEIGDMSLVTQAKMLRVLQSGDYFPVGSTKKMIFKGRIIAATNKNLKAVIKETPLKFRPDLFYRLNVLPIDLPPFKTLPEDARKTAIVNKLRHIIFSKSANPVADKLAFFLYKQNGSLVVMGSGEDPREVSDNPFISNEALHLLASYSFPGNYRELDAVLRRAYILSRHGKIEVSAVKDHVAESEKDGPSPKEIETTAAIDAICLKDITDYGESVKKDIVRKKLESVCGKGRSLKGVLRVEGVTKDKDYQGIRKRIVNIIGQEEMSRIVRSD